MPRIAALDGTFAMPPGAWRAAPGQDVAVGRHHPPSIARAPDFMAYFAGRHRSARMRKAARILEIPALHHRLNCIHPFPDGNGRVSRLMSQATAHAAAIGAHGLWSVSRGLARGLDSRSEYMAIVYLADRPRQGDLDGRGNLSQRALTQFWAWFFKVCADQVEFTSGLFEINGLAARLRRYVERSDALKPESARHLEEPPVRGASERGEVPRIAGLPERTARRVLKDVLAEGLLNSETPKGPLPPRFPSATHDSLFPRLFQETQHC